MCYYILRTGVTMSLAAFEFGIDKVTAGRYFKEMVCFVADRLRKVPIRLSQEKNEQLYPPKFLAAYPGQFIRDIIDCTEVFIQADQNLARRWAFYSDYKSHTTVKFLISISPQGTINYVSKGYPGRISDPVIVRRSGYLDILDPSDIVMADKGFKIWRPLQERSCRLVVPPFKYRGKDRNFDDLANNKKVANLRIHIERANKHIKEFRILQGIVPHNLVPYLSDIMKVCCFMVGQNANLTGSDYNNY